MSYLEIFLVALGLCADTLAVSMAYSATRSRVPLASHLKIDFVMGFVQASFAAAGWLLGYAFLDLITAFDHWVALGLLLFIGGKMIVEELRGSEQESHIDLMKPSMLLLTAVATSIDALAVGISFAMMDLSAIKLIAAAAMVFGCTAAVSTIGLLGGGAFKKVLGNKAGIAAGIILIAIGVKIFFEHVVF